MESADSGEDFSVDSWKCWSQIPSGHVRRTILIAVCNFPRALMNAGSSPALQVVLGLLLPFVAQAQQAPSFAKQAPSFAKDVAPIFQANCSGCHGANVRMGSLDLDTYEGLEKGGNHGKVVVPSKSEESRLYLMITGKAAPVMPLTGKRLAEGEIEIIQKWIDAGAQPPTAEEAKELAARLAKPAIPDIKPKLAVKSQIGALAYRPDGKLLALGTYKEVRLDDPATGKTVATLPGHAEAIRAIAFSRDGKYLAAAGGLPLRAGELELALQPEQRPRAVAGSERARDRQRRAEQRDEALILSTIQPDDCADIL